MLKPAISAEFGHLEVDPLSGDMKMILFMPPNNIPIVVYLDPDSFAVEISTAFLERNMILDPETYQTSH